MTLNTTFLFDRPNQAISRLITGRMRLANSISIVTGFATPGGMAELAGAIRSNPNKLELFIVGAATYPAFDTFEDLLSCGVRLDSLRVHLGHTQLTGGKKNPFAKFHPMMHSKIYFMELADGRACAFVGSHNATAFALGGKNGEASVLVEGDSSSAEFSKIRNHISEARRQAVQYSPSLKEAFAWWTREFIDGLKAEMLLPRTWDPIRTIVICAGIGAGGLPKINDELFFEIPTGIEQIESLKTQVHLYLFRRPPASPWQALSSTASADASITCVVLGVDNGQGNRELNADWFVDRAIPPFLQDVPSRTHRPRTPGGMQQVRARVQKLSVEELEYQFDREAAAWDPELSDKDELLGNLEELTPGVAADEARGRFRDARGWSLVTGLTRRDMTGLAKESVALRLASPESGAFTMVALRRRRRGKSSVEEES